MLALFGTMLSGFALGFGFGFRIGFRIQHQINSRIPDLGLDSIGFIIRSGFAANHNGISRFTKSDWISWFWLKLLNIDHDWKIINQVSLEKFANRKLDLDTASSEYKRYLRWPEACTVWELNFFHPPPPYYDYIFRLTVLGNLLICSKWFWESFSGCLYVGKGRFWPEGNCSFRQLGIALVVMYYSAVFLRQEYRFLPPFWRQNGRTLMAAICSVRAL